MSVKDRIQQYVDSKGIKTARLEKDCGLSSGYWRKTSSISAEACSSILRVYSDLSPQWVLLGEGPMLRQDAKIESLVMLLADEIEKKRAAQTK